MSDNQSFFDHKEIHGKWKETSPRKVPTDLIGVSAIATTLKGSNTIARRRLGVKNETWKEKNWSPFRYGDNRIFWSYSINPHIVCEMDVDLRKHHSDCVICQRRFASSSSALWESKTRDLIAKYGQGFLNSSAGLPEFRVVYHLNGVPSFRVENTDYYLGIMHTIVLYTTTDSLDNQEHNYKHYVHFFYKFSATPPFEIIELSAPIPLRVGKSRATWFGVRDHVEVAFVNGFELWGGSSTNKERKQSKKFQIKKGFKKRKYDLRSSNGSYMDVDTRRGNREREGDESGLGVLIAYGYADWSSRILRLSYEDVLGLFQRREISP